jgi:predicted ArsR family transcriptional regulator
VILIGQLSVQLSGIMTSDIVEKIYDILSGEPVTSSEIAGKVGVSYKTAQKSLLELAATNKEIACRKSGRIYLFWRRTQNGQ